MEKDTTNNNTIDNVNIYSLHEEDIDAYRDTLVNRIDELTKYLSQNPGDTQVQAEIAKLNIEIAKVDAYQETKFRDMEDQMGLRV